MNDTVPQRKLSLAPSGAGSSRKAHVTKVDAKKMIIGRYALVERLGVGGMGEVYLAHKTGPGGFEKWVAIKRIHPQYLEDESYVHMFLDEARIAAAVHHPNVAQVFDLGQEGDEYFIAMEYLHGEHLASFLKRLRQQSEKMDWCLAAHVISRIAQALHAAHQATTSAGEPLRLVHRDVSPHNIFLTYAGNIKLTDFGVAQAINRLAKTKTGGIKGKVAYMAPEQVLGLELDHRADVFSLGAVLWELIFDRTLFAGESDAAILMQVAKGQVPKPSSILSTLPARLEAILLHALAKEPDQRYGSALEMASDLDEFIKTQGRIVTPRDIAWQMERMFADEKAIKEDLQLRHVADPQNQTSSPANTEIRAVNISGGAGAVRQTAKGKPWLMGTFVLAVLLMVSGLLLSYAKMTRKPSVVHVDSIPRGAEIWIDGYRAGITPKALANLRSGHHGLTLLLKGYRPKHVTFDIKKADVSLHYDLTRQVTSEDPRTVSVHIQQNQAPVAYLSLLGKPWSSVSINGKLIGHTPLVRKEIPVGELAIEVRPMDQGKARTLRVSTHPGETISLSVW